MDKKRISLKHLGILCLIVGIVALASGILLLMFANSGVSLWIIIGSIILNVVAINLITMKKSS